MRVISQMADMTMMYGEMNNMKVKTLYVEQGNRVGISKFPNFHKSGSITGMKRDFYGAKSMLVRCGSYVYNVTSKPSIYEMAH